MPSTRGNHQRPSGGIELAPPTWRHIELCCALLRCETSTPLCTAAIMSHMGVKRLFFVAALLCVAAVPSVAAGCPFVHAKRSSADGTLEQQFLAAHGRSASVEELAARTVPESDASGDARGDASDQWEGQIPMASNTSDPLVVFNNLFHTVYSNVGVDVRPDPVILVVRGLCAICVCVCGCVCVPVCVCGCVFCCVRFNHPVTRAAGERLPGAAQLHQSRRCRVHSSAVPRPEDGVPHAAFSIQ